MAKVHIVSTLPEEHELVQKELSKNQTAKQFHHVEKSDDEDLNVVGRHIYDQILDLPVRVGETVIFVFDDNSIMEEHLCVSCIQRRLAECVVVQVCRNGQNRMHIPYMSTLRTSVHSPPDGGMVGYSYGDGCKGGGSCSSC